MYMVTVRRGGLRPLPRPWCPFCCPWHSRSGEQRTQNFRSPSAGNPQLSYVLSLKIGQGQTVTLDASPSVRNSVFLLYCSLIFDVGPFNFIFAQFSSSMKWCVLRTERVRRLLVLWWIAFRPDMTFSVDWAVNVRHKWILRNTSSRSGLGLCQLHWDSDIDSNSKPSMLYVANVIQ